MNKSLKITGIIFIIIIFVAGVTNPDSTTHLNKRIEKIETFLDNDTLLRNITYKNSTIASELRQTYLNSFREDKRERKNYILFSKVDQLSIGAFNIVWTTDNSNPQTTRDGIIFRLANIIEKKFNERYYSDVILICDEVLKGAPEGYKLHSLVRDGYFNSMRARSNYYLNNNSASMEEIKIIEKNKLANDWDFYTAYLAYDKIDNKNKALEYINKAIDKNGNEGKYYYDRGILYHDFGNREQACKDMYKANSLGYGFAGPATINYYCNY